MKKKFIAVKFSSILIFVVSPALVCFVQAQDAGGDADLARERSNPIAI